MAKVGRPPMFKDVEEMKAQIEEFFNDCGDHPTITGLCLHLGFESRQSFYDYQEKKEFAYTIKRARLMIENEYEKSGLSSKTPAFHIFALKNLGWSDRQELDHTTQGESMNVISLGSGNKPL